MNFVKHHPIDELLVQEIVSFVRGFPGRTPLAVEQIDRSGYQRSYLGRDTESGWEAILMV
ncbi:MAG: hypothetical protein LUD68_09195, partial [Rikenellaceae bacterium]|nr:hypothetical protein [Rikenellaceae bacterium]